jgi:hypothetical protein
VFFTVPLAVLAFLAPWLWPAPLTVFLVSVAASITAGLKAELPRRKRRWWSRLLIILLHFLQPIERGLARYRHRFRGTPHRPPVRAMEVQATGSQAFVEGDVTLWSRGDVERYQLLESLKHRLTEDGWMVTEDSGWSNFDLEVSTGRLAKVRLVTVHEDLEMGRRNIRCRITTLWRMGTGILFWVFAVILVLTISVVAQAFPWIWMLLLLLPAAMLLIDNDESVLAGNVRAYVGNTAKELGLIVVEPPDAEKKRSKVRPPPRPDSPFEGSRATES